MTGEYMDYEFAERRAVARSVARAVRCPVTVNCTHTTLEGALELAKGACGEGASAVTISPPPFFHRPPSDVREFLLRFGERMSGAVPLVLYNPPSCSDWISYETAEELLASGMYAGMKDASGDGKYFDRLVGLKKLVTYRLYVGNDELFAAALRRGADGAFSGCAGAVPELALALAEAIREGEEDAARRWEGELKEYLKWVERFPAPQALRETLAERCLNVGPEGSPIGEANRQRLREFREWLGEWLERLPKREIASLRV
jgi:4-hydroxy-tetrahydrodipicolinate synthase